MNRTPENDRLETPQDDRVAMLVQSYVSGQLNDDGARELEILLEHSPSLADLFCDQLLFDVLVRSQAGRETGWSSPDEKTTEDAPEQILSETDERALRAVENALQAEGCLSGLSATHRENPVGSPLLSRSVPVRYLLLLLFAVFAPLIYFEWFPRANGENNLVSGMKATLAVVTATDDVVWGNNATVPRPGEPLLPGMLRFESGTVELLFYSGVRGIVEGPAEFVLLDDSRVFCKQGRWSVTVPPQGQGFEIQAPHLTVRDLGTRFYAAIEKDRCDVHVVEGVVETERSNGDKAVFQTGAGAAYRGGEVLERISGLADYFVSPVEMRRRSDAVLFRHRPPSAGGVADLRSTAIRTVDFSREPVGDATLVGGERVEGPTPGSKAFRFTGRTDRIRLKPLGKLRSMTAVVRLRIDRLNDEMNPILMSEGSVKNGLVWQIQSHGAMLVGLRRRGNCIFQSPVVVTSEHHDQWVQFALTLDGNSRRLAVYMDGGLVFADTLSVAACADVDNLNLGCWKMHAGESSPFRYLGGDIGETLIFDRALGLEEIRLLQQ